MKGYPEEREYGPVGRFILEKGAGMTSESIEKAIRDLPGAYALATGHTGIPEAWNERIRKCLQEEMRAAADPEKRSRTALYSELDGRFYGFGSPYELNGNPGTDPVAFELAGYMALVPDARLGCAAFARAVAEDCTGWEGQRTFVDGGKLEEAMSSISDRGSGLMGGWSGLPDLWDTLEDALPHGGGNSGIPDCRAAQYVVMRQVAMQNGFDLALDPEAAAGAYRLGAHGTRLCGDMDLRASCDPHDYGPLASYVEDNGTGIGPSGIEYAMDALDGCYSIDPKHYLPLRPDEKNGVRDVLERAYGNLCRGFDRGAGAARTQATGIMAGTSGELETGRHPDMDPAAARMGYYLAQKADPRLLCSDWAVSAMKDIAGTSNAGSRLSDEMERIRLSLDGMPSDKSGLAEAITRTWAGLNSDGVLRCGFEAPGDPAAASVQYLVASKIAEAKGFQLTATEQAAEQMGRMLLDGRVDRQFMKLVAESLHEHAQPQAGKDVTDGGSASRPMDALMAKVRAMDEEDVPGGDRERAL